MVQQQLCQETGNILLLKDLSNIALAAKKGESRNDLDATVQVLMEKYGMRMNNSKPIAKSPLECHKISNIILI